MGPEQDGWATPIFQGMTEPAHFHGVPLLFFAFDMIGTMFLGAILLQLEPVYAVEVVLAGAGLYGLVWLGTAIDPYFWAMVGEWLHAHPLYEA
jgi:type IV secretory pathway VirB3-like protein